ncbi:TraB/GumN family protein [Sphingomonas sp.]|uniref:TraB/GumN family protein n=1 Tax=Sphingomonas sp. TaxID=28214 RepID=UPI0025D5A055|nr:TraB/GumN family protein [Sphingomonas sp.]
MKRIAFVALAALVLLSCRSSQTAAAPPQARPALWKVSDADTTIYLFGTIHVLPKGLAWQSPKIEKAIRASNTLMLETVLDPNPAVTGAIMLKLGMSPNLPPLMARVPADKRAALQKVVEKAGVPLVALDKFETWAAALTLASAGLQELNASADYGAEKVLTARFLADHKLVAGLETPTQQLGYFDSLSEAAQRTFLVSVADDQSDSRAEFDRMIAAWSAGDVGRIALTFDDELKLSPELSEALLRRRNASWAGWITARMAQPGTVFLAVGAGHLAGANSVEAMLATKGYKAVRLQ